MNIYKICAKENFSEINKKSLKIKMSLKSSNAHFTQFIYPSKLLS